MRHDLVAFRELDALVRNLSDQLAGYRRRALAAEARTRELEHAADALSVAASRAQDRAEAATGELATSEEALRMEREASNEVRLKLRDMMDAAARAAAGEPPDPSPAERAAVRENAELRQRLVEAGARTRDLSERLRFLRQQLATVSDK